MLRAAMCQLGRIGSAALPLALAATLLANPAQAATGAPRKFDSEAPELQVFDRFDLSAEEPVSSTGRRQPEWAPSPIKMPSAGTSTVSITPPGKAGSVSAEQAVTILSAKPLSAAGGPASVTVSVLSAKRAQVLGADAYAVTLRGLPVPSPDQTTPTRVRLSYAGFESMGGDFASRLRVVQLPACAASTPEKARCQVETTLTAERSVTRKTLTVSPVLSASGSGKAAPTVLALAAEESSETGDWSATPLSSSSSWTVGGSSGAFTWSYPLRTPQVAADTQLNLAIGYNSGQVDGRTVSENNQTSWVGEGFDLGDTFIERNYRTCDDDGRAGKGDLCWFSDNASVSFGTWSGELVRTTPGANEAASTWRLRSDSGATFERRTGGFNGDNNTEYWVMTTTDGTQYFFGQNKTSSRGTAANSAWKVPVFGDDAGEPCNASTVATSYCDQVWRWNLDRVVDANGNITLYQYAVESNAYERWGNTVDTYHRGGYLTSISYGLRSVTGTAPAKVLFTTDERCLPTASFDCAPSKLTKANSSKWPDVPFDQICATNASSCTDDNAPTFFTRKRLTEIETQDYIAGVYKPVDRWTLTHKFLATGDTTSPALNLRTLTHTGAAGAAIDLPSNKFLYVGLPNRVDGIGDKSLPFYKKRISSISTEHGASTTVGYSAAECTPAVVAGIAENHNDKRCYPQLFRPEGDAVQTHWFHKYVVDRVDVKDLSGASSADLVTKYTYLGDPDDPLWAWQDRPGIKNKNRTYSQWRGYSRVRTVQGEASDSTPGITETLYYRGMDGDRLTDTTTRDVTVTDSDGVETRDHWRLAGFAREVQTFTSVGGSPLTSSINTYDPTTLSTQGRTVVAAPTTKTDARSYIDGGAKFVTTTTNDYTLHANDEYLDLTASQEQTRRVSSGGTVSQSAKTCSSYTYARDVSRWILDPVATQQTVRVGCDITNTTDADVVSSTRTYYDNQALGVIAAGKQGNPTKVETKRIGAGETTKWITTQATYDNYGRDTSATDANGQTATTSYTGQQVTGGWPATVTETTPDPDGAGPKAPQTTVTTFNQRTAVPIKIQNPNGTVAEATYDALGRQTNVWQPGRDKATQSASTQYSYSIGAQADPSDTAFDLATGHNAITTKTLLPDGTSYRTSADLFDGLLRGTQTQTQTQMNDGTGNPSAATLITDEGYNSRGQVIYARPHILAAGNPTVTIQSIPLTAINNETRTSYDAAGRVTTQAVWGRNDSTGNQLQELWRTQYSYTGETTTTTPPQGGVSTAETQDARGDIVARTRFPDGASQPGSAVTYAYAYDKATGDLTTITDPDNNTWNYTYDTLGQRLTTHDPDAGDSVTSYDDNGNPLTSTMDPGGADQAVRRTEYDNLGRPTKQFETLGLAAEHQVYGWTYDTATNGTGLPASTQTFYQGQLLHSATVNTYVNNQPTSTTSKFEAIPGVVPAGLAGAYTTTTTYKPNGAPDTTALPAIAEQATETLYTNYDALGRARQLGGNGLYVRNAEYTPYGTLQRLTMGNQTGLEAWNDFWYDEATLRPSQVFIDKQSTPSIDSTRSYTYDDAGNPTRISDANTADGTDTQCFTYDGLAQLTRAWTPANNTCNDSQFNSATLGGPAKYRLEWTIDPDTGNRLTQTDTTAPTAITDTYQYGDPAAPHGATQITRAGGPAPGASTYAFDGRGNMTTRGTQALTWDASNHLSTVAVGGTTLQLQLQDATGRRVIRVNGGTTTVYHPDGTQAALATDNTGTADADRYYAFGGLTVAFRATSPYSGVTSLFNDSQGTTQYGYANTTAALLAYRQTPYGEARGNDPLPGERRFVGGTQDPTNVGFTQVGSRPYDPTHGVFFTVDPVFDAASPTQTASAYAYGYD